MTVFGRLAVTVWQSLTKSGGSFVLLIACPPARRVVPRSVLDIDGGCGDVPPAQVKGKATRWSLHFCRAASPETSCPPPVRLNADLNASGVGVRGFCRQSDRVNLMADAFPPDNPSIFFHTISSILMS